MNDDQQNQQPQANPGQTYQPAQPQVPQVPQQPAAPQQPQAPVNPYAAPQQQPAYQQPVQNYQQPTQQFAQPGGQRLPIKLLLIGAGVLVAITLAILLFTSFGSTSLSKYDNDEISFSVSLPRDWEVEAADLTSVDQVTAFPQNQPENENNRISVTRSTGREYENTGFFIKEIEKRVEGIQNESNQNVFEINVSNLTSTNYGSDEKPAFIITYDLEDKKTKKDYKVLNYHIFESNQSIVSFTFQLGSSYADITNVAENVVSSYQAR